MIARIVNIFILGSILLLIPDVLILAGVKINYLEAHDIHVYFNTFFVEHNNIYLFLIFAPLLGYFVFYDRFNHLFAIAYTVLVLMAFLVIGNEKVGLAVGEYLFFKPAEVVRYQDKEYGVSIYYGDDVSTYLKTSPTGSMKKIANKELSQ